jgi:hypothetical protein
MPADSHLRAARKWKKYSRFVRALDLIAGEPHNHGAEIFMRTRVNSNEYEQAMALKRKMLSLCEGYALEDLLPGEVLSTSCGECYHLHTTHELPFTFKKFTLEHATSEVLSNLKLLYGIGTATERKLKRRGYRTLKDLCRHTRWRAQATEFLNIFSRRETLEVQEWLGRWLPLSHPHALSISAFHKPEEFIIFDIESMGLFSRPIILIGVGRLHIHSSAIGEFKGSMLIDQYLVRDLPDEAGALTAFLDHLGGDDEPRGHYAFLSFNGRAYDMNHLRERMAFYGLAHPWTIAKMNKPHFDLLHFARRAWRTSLPDCRLSTLEKYILGLDQREEDIPSELVPEFYETYLSTKNVGPLIPIVEHNRYDLIAIAGVYTKLCELWEHAYTDAYTD